MRVEIKTKYTTVSFNEDHDGSTPILYSTVEFAWSEKDDVPDMARLFAVNMDQVVENEIRRRLAEELSADPVKDIYLEDTWLMIQGYSADEKHHTTKIVPIVMAIEAEFDRMLTCFESK